MVGSDSLTRGDVGMVGSDGIINRIQAPRKKSIVLVATRPSPELGYSKEQPASDIEDIHDVTLLLPPIDQHCSAKKLDQVVDEQAARLILWSDLKYCGLR